MSMLDLEVMPCRYEAKAYLPAIEVEDKRDSAIDGVGMLNR